ncbi:hypothetical protein E5357_09705 [Hominisplanchenecus murintestinalis]|uniref:Uncharacterized protein n=1 Tax=Hominisplanchenecus murintestinalis TaxID=2941517 RepID=A0AC61R093_9FIRM|nr:DUF6273 domain-containing protein [Hominisplanchenecus murintestinalis]TGX98227.1 hypothetical protein E5357_09705 [Hominisplanchenecus murintestinalis]
MKGKSKNKSGKPKRLLSLLLTATLTLSPLLAAMPERAAEKAEAADVTLKNPRIVADDSMIADQKVTWDCVWFGRYPQAEVIPSGVEYTALDESLRREGDVIVSDSVYSALQNASGWDANNDITLNGAKYRRMKKGDATCTSTSSGYYKWSSSADYHYFKYEPIKWRVLRTDGNQALLLSDVALDDQKYHTEYESVTWETSTARSWLNGYGAGSNKQSVDYRGKNFIGSAFTASEQAAIVNSSLENADSINWGTSGGNNTTDKVFLLSESDVCNTDTAESYGFVKDRSTHDEARRCKGSTYAKAMGMWSSTSTDYAGNGYWWLRSPGYYSYYAMFVSRDGWVSYNGCDVYNSNDGIRPALNLNLSSPNLCTYAGTVCSDGTDTEVGGGTVPPGGETPEPGIPGGITLSNPRIVKNPDMDRCQTVTWDCVYFGSYPQAEVISSNVKYDALNNVWRRDGDVIISDSIYSALQNAFGWDASNDITLNGAKYRRVRKEDAVYADNSDNYYQWGGGAGYHYFKYEPIKWRVLHTDGNQALLLSDIALDNRAYHTRYENVTWETSTIRSWLNGYGAGSNKQSEDYSRKSFIGSAFSAEEREAIASSLLENAGNMQYGTDGGSNTTDKVFLLSESDMCSTDRAESYGFMKGRNISDETRRFKSSTWAKAMGVWGYAGTDYAGNSSCWLRSPGRGELNAAYVSYYGAVNADGSNVSHYNNGVCPALNLNLSSNLYTWAGTVTLGGNDLEIIRNTGVVVNNFYGAETYGKTKEAKIQDAAVEFNEALENYLECFRAEAIKELGGEDKIVDLKKLGKELREADEKTFDRYITMNDDEIPDKAMDSVYYALADFLSNSVEKTVDLKMDIDFSKSSILNAIEIANYVRNGISSESFTKKYGEYEVSFDTSNMWTSFTGKVTVTGKKHTYQGIITSTVKKTQELVCQYLEALSDIVKDANKYALFSILGELRDVSCIAEMTEEAIKEILSDKIDILQKSGYGNVLAVFLNVQDGYQAIKSIIHATKSISLITVLKKSESLYDTIENIDFSKEGVKKKTIKKALQTLEEARKKLATALYNKIYDVDEEKEGFVDKVYKFLGIKCPVDVEVYNASDSLIGYVDSTDAHEEYVYYSEGIYIEVKGDMKYIYVPEDKDVWLKLIATDDGEMNYTVEEVRDGEKTGRLNYYHVPLKNGGEYIQTIPKSTPLSSDESLFPLTGGGTSIYADEYLSAEDMAASVMVEVETTEGGIVLGKGKYPKGEGTELVSLAQDDSWSFSGWYVGDRLVSSDKTYRFTVLENVKIKAVFEKRLVREKGYKITMSKEYGDSYVGVYQGVDGKNNIFIKAQQENMASYLDTVTIKGYTVGRENVYTDTVSTVTDGELGFWINEIKLSELRTAELYDKRNVLVASISALDREHNDTPTETLPTEQDGASHPPAPAPAEPSVKKGQTVKIGRLKYKVSKVRADGTGEVTLTGTAGKKDAKKLTSLKTGNTVKINKKDFKVTAIAKNAFKNCKKLKSAVIGKYVSSIGAKAFNGCRALKKITVKSAKLKKVGKNAFKGIYAKASVKAPKAKRKAYRKLLRAGGAGSKVRIK